MRKSNQLFLLITFSLFLTTSVFAEKVCIKNKASLTPRGRVNLQAAITKVTGACPARTTELFDLGNTLAAYARINYDAGTDTQTVDAFGGTGTTSATVIRQTLFGSNLGFKITFNGSYPQLTVDESEANRAKVIATASAEGILGHGPVFVTEASSSQIALLITTWNESDPITVGLSDWNIHLVIAN